MSATIRPVVCQTLRWAKNRRSTSEVPVAVMPVCVSTVRRLRPLGGRRQYYGRCHDAYRATALDAPSCLAGYEGSPGRSIIPLYSPTAVNHGAISVEPYHPVRTKGDDCNR